MCRIAIVGRDSGYLRQLEILLSQYNQVDVYKPRSYKELENFVEDVSQKKPNLLICELCMGDVSAITVFDMIKKRKDIPPMNYILIEQSELEYIKDFESLAEALEACLFIEKHMLINILQKGLSISLRS